MILFYLLSLFAFLSAEEKGIQFLSAEQYSFEEIKQMAQKENKPIFIDFWATWCGPCKVMEKEVLSQPEVGEKFNISFINYKADVDKSPGRELRNLFQVSSLPSYVFVKPNGDILLRTEGMSTVKFFMEDAGFAERQFRE